MDTAKPAVQISGPYGVQDTLRDGFRSISHELAPRHALQAQLAKTSCSNTLYRGASGAMTFGQHYALRNTMEKRILKEVSRQGGLPSSYLGLSIVDGTIETLNVEDVLLDGTCERFNINM